VKTEKGLSITPEGGKSAVAESLRKSDWLSAAGVTKGQAFTMDGLFDVPSDGLYQFQVRTRLKLALRVDDKVVAETAGNNEWQFVPCSLRTGTHRVQVKAEGGELGLDIRFGGEGTFSLDSGRFRHEVAEAPDPAVPEPK
jgi:hypothetical protein